MTAKEYLLQAFTIDRLLKARQTQIEELRAKQMAVGNAIVCDKVQSSPIPDRMAELTAKLLDMINEYTEDAIRLADLKKDIKQTLDKLDNPVYRLIMEERYLNLKRWEDIAADNNYSWQHVHKIHKRALRVFSDCCYQRAPRLGDERGDRMRLS